MSFNKKYKNSGKIQKKLENPEELTTLDPPLNTVENKIYVAELLMEKFGVQCTSKSTKFFSKEKHFFFQRFVFEIRGSWY